MAVMACAILDLGDHESRERYGDDRRRARRSFAGVAALLAALLHPGPANGDPGTESPAEPRLLPRHRIVYSNAFGARFNPLGVADLFSLGYRFRLYDDRAGPLWRDAQVGVVFDPSVSTAVERIGGGIEVQPLTILKLRASYYFMGFTGAVGSVQSFTSPLANFSDASLSLGKVRGRNYSTTGGQAELGAVAQIKFGPIGLRSEVVLLRSDMRLRAGDTVYYDVGDDALTSRNGWLVTNDSDLVYLTKVGLTAGLHVSVTEPFYPASAYPPGDPHENPNGPMLRLGPLAAYTFFERPGARVDGLKTFLLVNWWLLHRYRAGEEISRAMPYLVTGIAWSGDLLPWTAAP
jgi:hypothetical protein